MEADATQNAAQPKSRRRWYQYSLRTLLLFVTLAGCGLGWFRIKVREARKQEAAVAALRNLRVYAFYEDPRPAPQWLLNALGIDFFSSVDRVVLLPNTPITDACVEQLISLPTVKSLNLDDSGATEATLEKIEKLTQLRVLYLNKNKATDAHLPKLRKALPNCYIHVTPPSN